MPKMDDIISKLDRGDVRRRFVEEGRSARNLLVWSVPLLNRCNGVPGIDGSWAKLPKQESLPHSLASKLGVMVEGVRRTNKRCITDEKPRPRSVSAGRNYKLDYKARYWAFLFENLRRAVDEIHETCETDESIAECKEAIMVLDNYTKDFHCLIEWIHLKRNFDSTPPRNRPTSLTWEMRRPSSRSNLLAAAFRNISKPAAVRVLKFDNKSDCKSLEVQTDVTATRLNLEKELSISDKNVVGSVSSVSVLSPTRISVDGNLSGAAELIVHSSENTVLSALFKSQKCLSSTQSIIEPTIENENTSVTTEIKIQPQLEITSLCTVDEKFKGQSQSNKTSSLSSSPSCGMKRPSSIVPISKPDYTNQITAASLQPPRAPETISCLRSVGKRSGSNSMLNVTTCGDQSWADKVRGTISSVSASILYTPLENQSSSEEKPHPVVDEDSDGWKMVQRVRSKSRVSPPKKIDNSSKENIFCNSPSTVVGMENVKSVDGIKAQQSSAVLIQRNNLSRFTSVEAKEPKFKKNLSGISADSKVSPASAGSLPSLHLLRTSCNSSEPRKRFSQRNDVAVQSRPKSGKKSTRRSQSPNAGSTIAKVSTQASVASSTSQSSINFHAQTSSIDANTNSCFDYQKHAIEEISAAKIGFKRARSEYVHVSDECFNNNIERALIGIDVEMPSCENVVEILHKQDENICPLQFNDHSMLEATHETTDLSENELIYSRGMLWGEYMDCLDAEPRPPGRVIEIHEKLSSPSRKRSLTESIRRHEEKQAKAQEQRERFLEEKAQKGKELSKKVEEKRLWKEEVTQQKRYQMEHKLQRAEEKRRAQLLMIVRKAHDEEEKVNEIAFINSLEAQNKRHDVLSRLQGHEARLQDIQGERQRKQEEKAAKEAAAEERRRALEAERQAKLIEMQEKRKLKEHKIEQHLQEKEKERQELAREKARDREERLSALQAAQQATMEELQKKIQQKQVDSARRHEMNIEHIRHRAVELSILRLLSSADDAPQLVPYDTKKLCTLCNVFIATEVYLLSHLRGKNHQQAIREKTQGIEPSCEEIESYNLRHIIDAPADKLDPLIAIDKERQKTLRKRCKRLRHKMTSRSSDYSLSLHVNTLDSPNKLRIKRSMNEMTRCMKNCGSGPWPTNVVANLDRSLGELSRIIHGKGQNASHHENDQLVFYALGGIQILTQILSVITRATSDLPTVVPSRTLVNACNVYRLMSAHNGNNCLFILHSNNMMVLLDLLIHRLNLLIPNKHVHMFMGSNGNMVTSLPIDPVANALMQLIATVDNVLIDECRKVNNNTMKESLPKCGIQVLVNKNIFTAWVHDIISYTVSVGIVDNLHKYFSSIRGQIDDDLSLYGFIQQATSFLISLTKLLSCNFDIKDSSITFQRERIYDDTQLVATLQITELVGTISLLYGMLLHSGAPSRGETLPPQLSLSTLAVTISALHMLNNFAILDLQMFQLVVGAEGTSLEFRHIISYLLWYCSHWTNSDLLHELILILGYFTVLSPDNQIVIQAGLMPTVLQQLCLLPFEYFSDPSLVNILFPSIIACCFNNRQNAAILEQELSCDLLAHFIEEKKLGDMNFVPVKTEMGSSKDSCDVLHKWALERRFPRSLWEDAEVFFHSFSE